MRHTYAGRCHCGAVRFEADLDLALGTVKCNCSLCARLRFWAARARREDVRVLAGTEALAEFRGANPVAVHPFCRHCGVHPFQRVGTPNMTGAPYVNVNLACLDDLDPAALLAAPVTFCDGRNDAWTRAPAEVRHL